MDNKTIPQKYPFKKNFSESLKLFFIIIRPAAIPEIPNERAVGVVAYRSMDALKKAQGDYGDKTMRAILHPNDFMDVEELIKRVNAKEADSEVKPSRKQFSEEKMTITHDIGFDGFKSGLLFAVDKYLKEKKDKEQMKELIKKCKEK